VVSGGNAQVITVGTLTPTSGLADAWSGFIGKPLYVGTNGAIVTQSGLLSGMGWQRLGVSTSGGIILHIETQVTSGGITTSIAGAGVF
jgi:hypothetical protein